ncbi:MAG: PEP-CTERM sorting domain-containing protein [Planctomycetota bacterium]
MSKDWASKMTTNGFVRVAVLGGLMAWGAVAVAASSVPGALPYPSGGTATTAWGQAGVPWASSGATIWSNTTAAIGVDPSLPQNWGGAVTMSMTSGQSFSFSGTPTVTPTWSVSSGTLLSPEGTSRRDYAINATSGSLGTYYPNGNDRNNPGYSIQPSGPQPATGTQPATGLYNQNLNSFYVASKVLGNYGALATSATTDPYDHNGNLNIYLPSSGSGTLYSPGTDAAIIAGTFFPASGSTGITLQWRTRSPNEMKRGSGTSDQITGGAAYLASDVLKMSGQATGIDYVLQMSYSNEIETPGDQIADIAKNELYLGVLTNLNGNTLWTNAVARNVAHSVSTSTYDSYTGDTFWHYTTQPAVGEYAGPYIGPAGTGHRDPLKPFKGSFQSFLNSSYDGNPQHYYYEKSLDELRGSWGVDTTTNTAWAVLNYGSGIFAVVPEPGTLGLLAGGMVCLAVGAFWKRKAAKNAKVTVPENSRKPMRMAA